MVSYICLIKIQRTFKNKVKGHFKAERAEGRLGVVGLEQAWNRLGRGLEEAMKRLGRGFKEVEAFRRPAEDLEEAK